MNNRKQIFAKWLGALRARDDDQAVSLAREYRERGGPWAMDPWGRVVVSLDTDEAAYVAASGWRYSAADAMRYCVVNPFVFRKPLQRDARRTS